MERKRILKGKVVTLVTYPKYLSDILRPQIGEYDSPYVLALTPCEKVGDKFFDLRTGAEVKKEENMLEWINLSGTVFRYGNPKHYAEECLLTSRRFENGKLILFSITPEEITPYMLERKVFSKLKNVSWTKLP